MSRQPLLVVIAIFVISLLQYCEKYIFELSQLIAILSVDIAAAKEVAIVNFADTTLRVTWTGDPNIYYEVIH